MKKILLTTLLCCLFSIVVAQDWRPIPNGYKAHFRIDTADVITHSIGVDSVKVELISRDTAYFLNRVVGRCDTCSFDTLYCGSIEPHCLFLSDKHQFLQQKILKKRDGSYLFVNPDTLLLFPKAHLNQNWVFDQKNNISAWVDSIWVDSIFHTLDSVKRISLSNGLNFDLSQNNGLLHFPDFKGTSYYLLEGLEGPISKGKQILNFWDIYDFGVGDVFQYDEKEASFGSRDIQYYYKKVTILSKARMGDTLDYEVHVLKRVYYYEPFNRPDPWFFNYREKWRFIYSQNDPENSYPNEKVPVSIDGNHNIHSLQLFQHPKWGEGKFYGENDLMQIYPIPLWPIGMGNLYSSIPISMSNYSESYHAHLGKTFIKSSGFESGYGRFLLGYIRNGDTIGKIEPNHLYVSVNPQNDPLPVTIAPNPTSGITRLTCETQKAVSLSIHNALGQRIDMRTDVLQYAGTSGSQSFMIDLSNRPPGLYFIRLTAGDRSAVKRLVVRR